MIKPLKCRTPRRAGGNGIGLLEAEQHGKFYKGRKDAVPADPRGSAGGSANWFQRLIIQALAIGIGKRELMEDYYPDELDAIFTAWCALHGQEKEEAREVDVMEFLNL